MPRTNARCSRRDAPRVLVLEDEPDVRNLWVEALEGAGYPAFGVGSGLEALACLRERRPDLILLDMLMPGMDGFDFLVHLRVRPSLARIPVLIVSSMGPAILDVLDGVHVGTLGLVGVLSKPVGPRSLIERGPWVLGSQA